MAIIAITETQCVRHSAVGVYRDEGPPVPIPNTAVKLISADNTWLEAAREDKAMPTQQQAATKMVAVFFFSEGGLAMENKGGRVVFMPDIEYRAWVNRNKDLLEQIVKDKQVSTVWLRRGQNKAFLIRYFEECGYTITID